MHTTQSIHARYQEIRHRLPEIEIGAETGAAPRAIGSLLDIAEEADAFVFDAFGVLNVGETPIEGAAMRLDQLRARGCLIRVLTNAASYDRAGAIDKFRRLGMRLADDEIVTSRDATLAHMPAGRWGAIAAAGDGLHDLPHPVTRLGDDPAAYDAVEGFVFLSSAGWSAARQAMLTASLHRAPRPVWIANADLAAPRDDGFSQEPGFFGHLLADAKAAPVRFFGKPFPEIYTLAMATLPGIVPARIVMCGDTLHTDILGAAAAGWRSVLVTRDGLYAGQDVTPYMADAAIFPDWRLDRI